MMRHAVATPDAVTPRTVCLTVDAEPDCPPYLWTWRGIEEGMPRLMDLLASEGVPATVFATGETALHFPQTVRRIVDEAHELGNHGWSHRAFTELPHDDAEAEIRKTSALLRTFAPVTAFRAPYLDMPAHYLALLEADGYHVDCSAGRYKPNAWGPAPLTSLSRLSAAITPSWLRLPAWIRDPVLRRLPSPVVLFVHPWEFVDLRRASIPWDCRAGTGERALASLRQVIRLYKADGARFLRVREAVPARDTIA